MTRRILLVIGPIMAAAALLAGPTVLAQAPDRVSRETAPMVPASFHDLAADKLPAVVNVSTRQKIPGARGPEVPGLPFPLPPDSPLRDFFEDFFGQGEIPPRGVTALGSGFIIDPSGYVVTNNHVIAEASEVKVILPDDTELPAMVIGRDPRTDLALLKVESNRPLPALRWGDSDEVKVGDWVLAIGNPFGLGGTVTAGIISARARDIQAGPYDDFLQTDASINRGNSGGPLFDMRGRVVGVNTAILSPTGGSIGIGFAIPANVAQPVIAQLREHGAVTRGWLGVGIQKVTDTIAGALGLSQPEGVLVANVAKDGPAARAGIRSGDVIVSYNGQAVNDSRELQRLVAGTPVDQRVAIEVWRDGKRQTLDAQVARLEDARPPALAGGSGGNSRNRTATVETQGLSLSPLTPDLREEFGIDPDTSGVLVTDVAPDSPAAEQGLEPGDVITQIGPQAVTRPQEVESAIEKARQGDRKVVLLLRAREGAAVFVPLPVEKKPG